MGTERRDVQASGRLQHQAKKWHKFRATWVVPCNMGGAVQHGWCRATWVVPHERQAVCGLGQANTNDANSDQDGDLNHDSVHHILTFFLLCCV